MGDDDAPEAVDLEQVEMMADNMGVMRDELMARGFSEDNAVKIILHILGSVTK